MNKAENDNLIKALELLYKALPYVQFYDDQDHPEAAVRAKSVCKEIEFDIAELREIVRANTNRIDFLKSI